MRAVAAAAVFLLANPGQSSAHRLDEYLQATRVSLARDRVTLEIDLTPGANIAPAINALLDRDGDKAISPAEAEAYARVVLSDLVLKLDDRSVAVTLTRAEVPSLDEMRNGLGTIQVRAFGDVEAAAGRRYLHFRNNHYPEAGVYLVNALLPDEDDVDVVDQTRDSRQREVVVEYHIGPYWPAQVAWFGFAAVGLAVPFALGNKRLWNLRRSPPV